MKLFLKALLFIIVLILFKDFRFYCVKCLMCADFVLSALIIFGLIKNKIKLVKTSMALLTLLLITPIGRVMLYNLEHFQKNFDIKDESEIKGLILLGGFYHLEEKINIDERPIYNLAAGRLTEFVILANKYKTLPIFFTGTKEESILTKKLLLEFGIEEKRFHIDYEANNTVDNAKNIAKVTNNSADKRPFLLVTSAFHMPRSLILFKDNNVNVEPYCVDYHTRNNSILKMFQLSFDHMNLIAYSVSVKEIFAIMDLTITKFIKKLSNKVLY